MSKEKIGQDIRVRRDDLSMVEIVETPVPDPKPGQALLKIDRFALTSNNITYGVAGDMLSYWQLFPAPKGWGRIPAWGFVDVLASQAEGIEVGERFYGYVPMSTHLLVQPDQVNDASFFDRIETRSGPHDFYHQYLRCAADPFYTKESEAIQALFRPLFATSFVIDDFLDCNDYFGAEQIILGSASSKTAIGTAFLLSHRANKSVEIIGLTSPDNKAFVEKLGHYDQVVSYDDIDSLSGDKAASFVDMSGSAKIIGAIHNLYKDNLKNSSIVGITHYEDQGDTHNLPGAKPTMFFAPAEIASRIEKWGPATYQERLLQAWDAFTKPDIEWLTLIDSRGVLAARRAYTRLLTGSAHPSEGHVISLWED